MGKYYHFFIFFKFLLNKAVNIFTGKPLKKVEYYILEDREPVKIEDPIEWGKWFQREENKYVTKDTIGNSQIITFFLGIDKSLTGNPPILFQTMVIDGRLDGETDYHATWQEAEAGHKRMLKRVRSIIPEKTE